MKKTQEYKLPKLSADQIAAQLRRGAGEVRAIKIASHLAKTLDGIKTGDLNHDVSPMEEVKYNARVWQQVHNILQKEK